MSGRKRKNLISLVSLLVLLALVIGFYIWYVNKGKSKEDDDVSEKTIQIETMDTDLINEIHYKNQNVDMTLVKEDGVWIYQEERERPIGKAYVNNIINVIDRINVSRIISENPEDLGKYGLSSPRAVITAKQSDGKTVTLMIGKKSSAGEGHYVKLGNADTVYLMKNIPESYISYTLIDMTDIEHGPSIESNNIYHLEVLQKDKDDFEVIYDPDLKYYKTTALFISSWAILKPYDVVYAADLDAVSKLLANYSSFNFKSCVDYAATDFAQYGLDDPQASIFIEYYEQVEVELDEPEVDPETGEEITTKTDTEERSFKLLIGNQNEDGDYYVRKDGDDAVYVMSASNVKNKLNVDAFSTLSKFVHIHNIDSVDKVEINVGGTLYTMSMERETTTDDEGKEEINTTYYYNGKVVDEDTFKDVYQVVIGAKIDRELKEPVTVDGIEPVVTVSFYTTKYDEPFTTSYYPYDDSFYLIDTGGQIRFVADKRKIDALIKAVQEFKGKDN